MFSLTLGFVIFLNIVCKIPFSKDLADVQKQIGQRSITIGSLNLPLFEIEQHLKKYEYAFENWGVATPQIYNKEGAVYYEQREEWSFKKNVDMIKITDFARRKSEKIGVIGITPFYDQALENEFIETTMVDAKLNK